MWTEELTNLFLKEGVIEEEEKEVVAYGLESLGGNILGLVITLFLGIVFKLFAEAVVLWIILFPLRKTVGGYHASTKMSCFFISSLWLILVFYLFTAFDNKVILYVICPLVASCIIWVMSPVENLTKRLDFKEYSVYRARSRKILLVEGCIYIFSLITHWECITRGICMAFVLAGVSVLLGKFCEGKV